MFRTQHIFALLLTLTLHTGVWLLAGGYGFKDIRPAKASQKVEPIVFLELMPPPHQPLSKPPSATHTSPSAAPTPDKALAAPTPPPSLDRPRASMAAPPAPTAEEWAFAAHPRGQTTDF